MSKIIKIKIDGLVVIVEETNQISYHFFKQKNSKTIDGHLITSFSSSFTYKPFYSTFCHNIELKLQ